MSTETNIAGATNSIANSINSVGQSINKAINDVTSKDLSSASSEFVNTNTLIAKFVFLILILIIFMVLLHLGIYLILYFTKPDKQPYLIKGLSRGNRTVHIPQDPKKKNSIYLYRSNNENTGIEFTWAVWLRLEEVKEVGDDNDSEQYKHIFNKGPFNAQQNEITTLGNGPGVYFYKENANEQYNKIAVIMETVLDDKMTVDGHYEKVIIDNLPIRRWFHLAVRVQNKVMDIYINGTVAKRVTFSSLPKQNFDDVFVAKNGGFNGELSDLRYFDSALNVFQLLNIVHSGPNLRSNDADLNRNFDYLANSWFMTN